MDLVSLKHPLSIYEDPYRLSDISSWHEHIPFAFALVHLLKPKLFVELGTHKGDSFLAFCQAIKSGGIACSAFAVDTWVGEEHAGFYSGEIFEELKAYHDPLYGDFSTLLRSTFDEALGKFGAGSIDLLHIDGLHTFAAVRHDFEAWLPKMGATSVVLLHDTNVRERDFGVWKLWEEISRVYPSFEFTHGHGLGVLAVGGTVPAALQGLFNAGADEVALLRRHFSLLGSRIALKSQIVAQAREMERRFAAQARETERLIAEKEQLIAEKDQHIRSLQDSWSWKITKPLRSLNDVRSPRLAAKNGAAGAGAAVRAGATPPAPGSPTAALVAAEQWCRIVMDAETNKLIATLPFRDWSALEVSGDKWRDFGFRGYRAASYPDFDLCSGALDERFDLIIAEQVFEHLLRPGRAAENVFTMLKPGGRFLITTPFLLKIHADPLDCSRWTETGIRHLLAAAGFPLEGIESGSWGNRECVIANFDEWTRYDPQRHSLRNDPELPIVVWALARKP